MLYRSPLSLTCNNSDDGGGDDGDDDEEDGEGDGDADGENVNCVNGDDVDDPLGDEQQPFEQHFSPLKQQKSLQHMPLSQQRSLPQHAQPGAQA